MAIIRKHSGEVFPAHGLHGNTIREAIAFIWTGFVQLYAINERPASLRNDADVGIGEELLNGAASLLAKPYVVRTERQEFREYLVYRDDGMRWESGAEAEHVSGKLVASVG